MEWYQGYQDYQCYQGSSFRSLHQQRRFQQEMASNNDQWSNGIHMLNEKLDAFINMVQQQSDPYSNTYNTEWRNQSNVSWEDQGNNGNFFRPFHPSGFQQRQFQQESKQPLEIAVEKLANATSERFERLEAKVDQLASSNKNIEVQLGQLANSINSWG